MTGDKSSKISPQQWKMRLRLIGAVILLLGYGSGFWIWQDQSGATGNTSEDAPLSTLDSRKDSRQIEIYYGKAGIVMEQARGWLYAITHGTGLAKTLIILSSGGAVVCFVLAAKMPG